MKKNNLKQILLIEKNCEQSNQLKVFLNILNFFKVQKPIRFSYFNHDSTLIDKLSLRENIHLDSLPVHLSQTKDFQLNQLIEQQNSPSLTQLFELIKSCQKPAKECSTTQRNITGFIKAILAPGDYLLINKPEKAFTPELLTLVEKALIDHFQKHSVGIILESTEPQLWLEHIHGKIKRQKNNQFIIEYTRQLTSNQHHSNFRAPRVDDSQPTSDSLHLDYNNKKAAS